MRPHPAPSILVAMCQPAYCSEELPLRAQGAARGVTPCSDPACAVLFVRTGCTSTPVVPGASCYGVPPAPNPSPVPLSASSSQRLSKPSQSRSSGKLV